MARLPPGADPGMADPGKANPGMGMAGLLEMDVLPDGIVAAAALVDAAAPASVALLEGMSEEAREGEKDDAEHARHRQLPVAREGQNDGRRHAAGRVSAAYCGGLFLLK